jgi:hypothetical protein
LSKKERPPNRKKAAEGAVLEGETREKATEAIFETSRSRRALLPTDV